VRIFFTFTGGRGHVDPLLPFATAAQAAGHSVAFAGRPSILPSVEALGFEVYATEEARTNEPPERIPLLELDAEREERDFRDAFGDRIARDRATRMLALCADWQPDLVVSEETDFGSMIAAERLGLSHATVLVLVAGFVYPGLVAEPLDALRAEHGLSPDQDLSMPSRYLVLAPLPPSFRDPAFPLPATAHAFRPLTPGGAGNDAPPPPWPLRVQGAPTIYFTLGTVFNLESGDLFERVLAGLGDLRVNVVATVGSQIDPAEFGSLPENVHVERYIPQSLVLPHCDAVVSHGGSGSVLGSLAFGLPMVLIPMGADQPLNAARCEKLGAARVLDAIAATPETVREAVSSVLSDSAYRSAAERMRDEIAALPGPEEAVPLLERLATEKRAVVSSR